MLVSMSPFYWEAEAWFILYLNITKMKNPHTIAIIDKEHPSFVKTLNVLEWSDSVSSACVKKEVNISYLVNV